MKIFKLIGNLFLFIACINSSNTYAMENILNASKDSALFNIEDEIIRYKTPTPTSTPKPSTLPTISELIQSYHELQEDNESLFSHKTLINTINICSSCMLQQLMPQERWLMPHGFIEPECTVTKPLFVQRELIAHNAQVIVIGDIHGHADTLFNILYQLTKSKILNDDFILNKTNTYIVFLGDYTDRGSNGIEVMYLLMRLKIENPQHVILLRGNHENEILNASYGFQQELLDKYGPENAGKVYPHFLQLFDQFPSALYLGRYNQALNTADF